MTRADVKTFAWISALALAFLVAWRLCGTYLTYELAEIWVEKFPAKEITVMSTPSGESAAADTVQVEDPYATLSGPASWLAIAIPLGIIMLVGYLCARNFEQYAARRAAAVMFTTMYLAMVIELLVYWPHNSHYLSLMTWKDWMSYILVTAVRAMVGAVIAWLVAIPIVRWRARG